MKERPIIFSAPMVRATLTGAKTQTRRVAKPVHHPDFGNLYTPGALVLEHEPKHVIERACPYGQPGDRLYVRETFSGANYNEGPPRDWVVDSPVWYWADGNPQHGDWTKPKPGIHMPRWASRITLEVTSVRVERLREISEADAISEGVRVHPDHYGKPRTSIYNPVQAYRDLWESINGPGSWELNQWVWVVEFRRLEGGAA